MSLGVVISVGSILLFILALAVLTGVGGHRRGDSVIGCVLCALVFPATWIAWFIDDNHAAGRSAFKGQ